MKWLTTALLGGLIIGALGYDWLQQDMPTQPVAPVKRPLVITHLWATWCPPCMAEMPELLESTRQLPPSTTLVMLSLDMRPDDVAKAYARFGISPTANPSIRWDIDPDQSRARSLISPFKVPTTIIQDAQGRIRQTIGGSLDWVTFIPALASF